MLKLNSTPGLARYNLVMTSPKQKQISQYRDPHRACAPFFSAAEPAAAVKVTRQMGDKILDHLSSTASQAQAVAKTNLQILRSLLSDLILHIFGH